MSEQKQQGIGATVIIRVVACIIILAIGFAGFRFLKSRKKAPAQAAVVERPLKVEVASAEFIAVPVTIKAHGELRSIRMVEIAAEVAGTIVEIYPRLQVGSIIPKGELLFAIDDRDYRTEYESSKNRYAILDRDRELAENELKRVRALFEKNKVGTRAGVEKAEQAANSVADRLALVKQAMVRAGIQLERCRVTAPFTCRITKKSIEKGQYVTPGKFALGLADDSILELEVPIDSGDAFDWLQFNDDVKSSETETMAWFSSLKPVQCEVSWTEDAHNRAMGIVDRVSFFDEKTRTVKIVLTIDSSQFRNKTVSMPLVAGMFCRVEIPGKSMDMVIELPRWAVSFEDTVYVVRNGRLETVPVEVARLQGENTYISNGLAEGDLVITTRLVNPLERSLVKIVKSPAGVEK